MRREIAKALAEDWAHGRASIRRERERREREKEERDAARPYPDRGQRGD